MSASIETTQVDAFVQDVCRNRDITPAERGQQAALALSVHVAQEHSLLIGTSLPVDEYEVEMLENGLEYRASVEMDALMEKSYAAFEWMEDQYPEGQEEAHLTLVKDVSDQKLPGDGLFYIRERVSFDKENWHPTVAMPEVVHETHEGNTAMTGPPPVTYDPGATDEEQDKFNRWYNDDKDEQR